MVKPVKIHAAVGRQRITSLTPSNQAAYITGVRDAMKSILRNYQQLLNELELQSADILYEALQPTFELSQKYCPVDTGALKASGYLDKQEGKNARVVIGYGAGGNPSYAVFVHELTHLAHKAPTRAKFLLAALEEDAPGIQARILRGYQELTGLRG